ncbi:MAG TPA: hypothetical protein VJX69_10480 [Terriglobales bacterium]|nr:hypothetical protein [Terriglobales bacterium]
MALYPESVARCQHIRVNGTQCGSPALRDRKFCYYHIRYHWSELELLPDNQELLKKTPTLEDANSIQVALADVMFRLVTEEVDHKTAALLLYALQTASMNLKRTTLEPELPTQVVIDRECVERRPIGATAWSAVEGREYDEIENVGTRDGDAKRGDARKDAVTKQEPPKEESKFMRDWKHLVEGLESDPKFLDRPAYQPREEASSAD